MNRDGIIERFNANWIPEANSGCWLWTGPTYANKKNGKDLRPKICFNGKSVMAYRFSYELFHGPIPDRMMVCHKCDTGVCVNPDHLFAGTAKDNYYDSLQKGRDVHSKLGQKHNFIRPKYRGRKLGDVFKSTPFEDKIRESYKQTQDYKTLLRIAFPDDRSHQRSVRGGPPACALHFGFAIRRMGGTITGKRKNRVVFIPPIPTRAFS